MLSAIRDITERKRAQEALEEKTRALEAAQEALVRKERLAILGQLAGGVSHELRNPLGVIKNSVYYLKMVTGADEKVAKHLGIVEREIVTANRIVTGLLDFARVTPPNRVAVELSRLVREYFEQKPLPGAVEVVLELADDLPAVSADPDQLLLMLGNLVSNAVQAMPEGGQLTVRTASGPEGRRGGWLSSRLLTRGRGSRRSTWGRSSSRCSRRSRGGSGWGWRWRGASRRATGRRSRWRVLRGGAAALSWALHER